MRAKHSPGRNRWVYRALGVLAFLVLASPLLAQETPRQPLDTQALQRVVERDQTLQARLAAIASDKQAFVSEIVSAWADNAETRGFGSTWRQDLENVLMSLSPEKLAAARDAKTYTELRAAVFSPNVLGDNNRDLVYFPVTPCRLVDTRLAGGPIAAGFTRSFVMNGSLTGQGGNASGCGIPV